MSTEIVYLLGCEWYSNQKSTGWLGIWIDNLRRSAGVIHNYEAYMDSLWKGFKVNMAICRH